MTVFRKEYKYVISILEYPRLQHFLSAVMKPDEHSQNGSYPVRSLYFDSLYDNDYYDNQDGLLEKRKIRIRIYEKDTDWAKLEWKCKNGSDGVKYGVTISREEAKRMEQQDYGLLMERKEEAAKRIYMRLVSGAYVPKTIVDYKRKAYLYPASDVRITFDTDIRGSVSPYGLFTRESGMVPLLPGGFGILEIKYNDFLPGPIKAFTKYMDNLPQANSKYSRAREIIR